MKKNDLEKLNFEKLKEEHLELIYSWLNQDFIMEFWDNTQAHKDDINNFVEGRKHPSDYANGKFVYWIAKVKNEPVSMIMTIQETLEEDIEQEKLSRISTTGNTYGIDYMIGNPNFYGKGYGPHILSLFVDFFRNEIDKSADTFFIDPAADNPKAKHVYIKAGFEHVCDFLMAGEVSGSDKKHHLMIKKF